MHACTCATEKRHIEAVRSGDNEIRCQTPAFDYPVHGGRNLSVTWNSVQYTPHTIKYAHGRPSYDNVLWLVLAFSALFESLMFARLFFCRQVRLLPGVAYCAILGSSQ